MSPKSFLADIRTNHKDLKNQNQQSCSVVKIGRHVSIYQNLPCSHKDMYT